MREFKTFYIGEANIKEKIQEKKIQVRYFFPETLQNHSNFNMLPQKLLCILPANRHIKILKYKLWSNRIINT